MIIESYPWKVELRRFSRLIRAQLKKKRGLANFQLEKNLFYSAFVVRKLWENHKLTDATADFKLNVAVYDAITTKNSAWTRAKNDFEFGRDFKSVSTNEIQISIDKVASEIIHSHLLVWLFDEDDVPASFIVSSYKNADKRALGIPFLEWLKAVDAVVADDIVAMSLQIDAVSGKILRSNR